MSANFLLYSAIRVRLVTLINSAMLWTPEVDSDYKVKHILGHLENCAYSMVILDQLSE